MSAPSEQDDVVRLAVAGNPLQATLWKQALVDQGVQCMVVGEYLGELFGGGSGSIVELWVHRDDLARAEAILEAERKGESPVDKA